MAPSRLPSPEPPTDDLLLRAEAGDRDASQALFDRHRHRLKKLVNLRLDPRLRARLDPSDVVQEVLVRVAKQLPRYLRERPLPFYPWIRRLTLDRLGKLHKFHLAQRRHPDQEVSGRPLSDDMAAGLAHQLAGQFSSPSARAESKENVRRVREALEQVPSLFQETLVLRFLEDLSLEETAAILDIPVNTVKTRQYRGIVCLKKLLEEKSRQ